ncbi:MAG TPA: exosortase B [Rubrivivax sp.]|nr:exosortase B [Rubrivivax sp.]
MNAAREGANPSGSGRGSAFVERWIAPGADLGSLLLLLLGFLVLYAGTYAELATGAWTFQELNYGPLILAVSLWLFYRERHALSELAPRPALRAGYGLLVFGLLLYVLGVSQSILMFEVGSQIPLIAAVLLIYKGWRAVRLVWVPLLLLCFLVPLPELVVAWVTGPLKIAVSAVATQLLHAAGYPVARSGVIMTVGQYQLLVADACAGLSSILTLEVVGIVYMKLVGHVSVLRNSILALLLVPVAFVANVVRVIVLVLVTYYLGDAAGQGFVHSLAGLVLIAVATVLMIVIDSLLGLCLRGTGR